jgi:hypothetical protein
MPLWDYFQDLFTKQAQHKLKVRIGPDRCTRKFTETEVRAGEHYVRIVLAQMFVHDEQVFLKKYRPAVHSLVKVTMGEEPVQIPNIADSSKVALKPVGGAAIIDNNYELTPPLPFNGGDLGIDVGMVAVPVDNILERYLGTLAKFSSLLNVTQLSSVLKIAEPLALGIQELVTAGQGSMHLGYHDSFSARKEGEAEGEEQLVNPLRQGYLALVDAPTGQLDSNSLFVVEDSLHTGTSLEDGKHQPLTGYDYMLIRFEVRADRDDWRGLATISDPLKQALTTLSDPNVTDPVLGKELLSRANLYLRQAQLRARTAPELTIAHRRVVVKELQKMVDEAKADSGVAEMNLSTPLAGGEAPDPLARAMLGVKPETIAAEARRGEITEEEIFEMGS